MRDRARIERKSTPFEEAVIAALEAIAADLYAFTHMGSHEASEISRAIRAVREAVKVPLP